MAKRAHIRQLHPRALTLLGELGSWVFEFAGTRDLWGQPFKGGRMLCSSADGRWLYFLRPVIGDAPVPDEAWAAHVDNLELYERFMHRAADKMYNTFCPDFLPPRLVGGLAIVRYFADKGVKDGAAEYEHYFEEQGIAPAYPRIFAVGNGQYVVPPGPFRVTEAGIEFGRDH